MTTTETNQMTRSNGAGQMTPMDAPADAYAQRRALMPTSYQEAFSMATAMAKSGLFAAKTPEQAVTILMTGMELGLMPAQAMRGIYIVQNRPVLSADMMVAICKGSPACNYFTMLESTPDQAVYETHRRGDPKPCTMTYTMEDAKRAGLTNKDTWKQYPAQLLRARCSSGLARTVYPDLLLGIYTEEEIEKLPHSGELPPDETRAITVTPPNPEQEERIRFAADLFDRMKPLPGEVKNELKRKAQHVFGVLEPKKMTLLQLKQLSTMVDEYEQAMAEQTKTQEAKREFRDAKAEAVETPEQATEAVTGPEGESDPFAEPILVDVPATPVKGHGHGD
jgi:hypothetical protein